MLEDLEAADEISNQVDRLLRQADAYGRLPTPVDDIVSAANLSQADDYLLDESMIAKAPPYLRHLLRNATKKIQGLVDRRERVIHVSPTIDNDGKRRFVKLHETVHSILPHQRDLLYADDNETLASTTRLLFEREANQGAAELLFQRNSFTRDARDLEISMAAVVDLADRYGSSIHAAVRRYAETHPAAVAAIVLRTTPCNIQPETWQRQEFMATKAWAERFGKPNWPTFMSVHAYPFLGALSWQGLDSVQLVDRTGFNVRVKVDKLQTPYSSFVLLWIPPRARLARKRRVRLAEPVSLGQAIQMIRSN